MWVATGTTARTRACCTSTRTTRRRTRTRTSLRVYFFQQI
nr:MAG TPA: hypothetical protein [Caudoviricetes sp.]